MESPNHKFALYGGTNECARTNTLLLLLSEVSTGAVSLVINKKYDLPTIRFWIFLKVFCKQYCSVFFYIPESLVKGFYKNIGIFFGNMS